MSIEKKPSPQPALDGMIISDTAIRQPVFITMMMLLAVVIGLICYSSLSVSLLPDINVPVVSIRVTYAGAGPDSVADQVTRPIEDSLSTVSGVDRITSTSSQGVSSIVVEFTDTTDVDSALQDVREKISAIRNQLPDDIGEPVFAQVDPNQNPIITVAISQGQGQADLRQLVDDQIVPQIQSAPGVGSVDVTGGQERQINVLLDMSRLQWLRVLPSTVSAAIAQANADVGLGTAVSGGREYDLRAPSVFHSPEDIASVGLGGTGYTVGDVASIEDGRADATTLVRLNGSDAVVLDIRNQSETNVVAVADAAIAKVDALASAYPDLQFAVIHNDAVQVRANVDGAIEEILISVVLAMLVVWLFFRDVRNTLVTVVGLPVIILATFAMMAIFHITINIVSLLAISVAVGLVIDDAIVVRENIFRHMERGETPAVASSRATAQVSASVLAMTLTIIVVFAPTAFTTGTTGILFYSFGITVAAAMALSLIEAFTLAPMLSAYWFKQLPPKPLHIKPGEEHLPHEAHEQLGRLELAYARLLRWTLRHRMLTLGIGAAFVLLSVLAASTLKFSFLPTINNHRTALSIQLPPGATLADTDAQARQIEQVVLADHAVASVLSVVGPGGASESATFQIALHEDAAPDEVRERLRAQLGGYPGVIFALDRAQGGLALSTAQRPVGVRLRSTGDIDDLAPVAERLMASFRNIPGLADMDMTYVAGSPQLQFQLDQDQANRYGLTNQTMGATLRALNDGDTATTYRESGDDYDVVVRLRPQDRTDVANLGAVALPLGSSDVPISSLTAIVAETGPTSIRRNNRMAEIVIGANNIGRNVNDVQADMRATVAAAGLPPEVIVSNGGSSEDQSEGFRSLLLAGCLSVLLVYVVLASQFGSFLQPLVIMMAMPLSFLGAFVGLWLTGLELDIVSMIGMLMLLGLVVKNSILLVDFTNQLQTAGMGKEDALERAGAVRLRPILMTSTTILLGAVPSAIGLGEGSELRRGLSTVVIGGVITSTLLTLLLIPTAYSLLQSLTARMGRGQRPHAAPAPAGDD